MTEAYHGQKFLIRKNGFLLATPLLAVPLGSSHAPRR